MQRAIRRGSCVDYVPAVSAPCGAGRRGIHAPSAGARVHARPLRA